ncbi:unnamed protein product, partial [Mesorhabditis belari]|uniref:Uncharacterized protein n=1 Tax=Mesorhabditis belari TaxID=2138241 RepID=A0AAF3FIM1_9BILA
MQKPIGIRVFPSQKTSEITSNAHVLHYRVPPEEPPIDYTLREKPKVRADYRVVFPPVREHPDDYFGEIGDAKSITSRNPVHQIHSQPTHHIHEVIESAPAEPIPNLPMRMRRNTADEVLHDLDSALEDEQYDFEEIRDKVKAMNLSFRQYSPGFAFDSYDSQPAQRISDDLSSRVHRLAVSPPNTTRQAIQTGNPMNAAQGLNDSHRNHIETQRRKAELEIKRARQVYNEDFFFDQTPEFERNSRTRTPEWKRRLIARRMAAEAIRQHEERVLEDFYEWKRRFEPSYLDSTYSPKGSARLPR